MCACVRVLQNKCVKSCFFAYIQHVCSAVWTGVENYACITCKGVNGPSKFALVLFKNWTENSCVGDSLVLEQKEKPEILSCLFVCLFVCLFSFFVVVAPSQ